ncbi:hypothetical protein BTE56_04475 [Agrobacterium pusense]|uniref:GlxA family transcriptional regulator n=2 Tax=Agrobacterium pusense TaxID=648995 RepID=UPI00098F8C69|nr:GlxA family transcriptional regulator [Agrobacterium pusense]OOO22962.1 hypothetical protein BTE56_04475 [Agrobacterium pusense]
MTMNDQKMPARLVLILAFPGVQILDIAGPAQALTTANEEGAAPGYDVRIVSPTFQLVQTASGFPIAAEEVPVGLKSDMVVIPGGPGVYPGRQSPGLIDFVRGLSSNTVRVCSVCTGAFLLAQTGLLDGRKAVTHWRSCERLAADYPNVSVDPDPLFLRDGQFWTTAGVTAGIDLMLNLIENDHGAALASRVARRLVVYMRRAGGQKQYSEPLTLQQSSASPYDALLQKIATEPAFPWTVEAMAEYCGQSLRTFHRRYEQSTGVSPAKAIEKIRCDLARALLHTSEHPIKEIARRVGFGSELRLRRAMLRHYGVGPNELRHSFPA